MVFDQWGKNKKIAENNLRGIAKDPAYRESAFRRNSNIGGASDIESQDIGSDSQVRDIKSNADNQEEDDESV